jgi:hypothetical protein
MANVLDEKLKAQAYEQAKNNNWDAVGETINQLAGYHKDGVDSTGNVGWSGSGENWAAAKKYMNDLQSEFSYDANEYYGNMIRENGGNYTGSSGGGSRGSSGGSSGGEG